MADWYNVCEVETLREKGYLSAAAKGRLVALFSFEGDFFALQGMCTHGPAVLTEGVFERGEIVCPLHQGRFCIRTGEATGGPVWDELTVFPTKVENGLLYVQI